jgi:hypothetical protein
LHYGWSLVRLGLADVQRWHHDVAVSREAVADRRLGIADLVLVSFPPMAELWRRREADTTRRRRNFERHVQLAEPLRDWYSTLDRVCPGRVRWHLPSHGVVKHRLSARTDRYDLGLFDRFIEALPPVYGSPDLACPDDGPGKLSYWLARSAARTALRNSIATVVGPTPPTRGLATWAQASSTSGRRRRPA